MRTLILLAVAVFTLVSCKPLQELKRERRSVCSLQQFWTLQGNIKSHRDYGNSPYKSHQDCTFKIIITKPSNVILNFHDVSIEDHATCKYDYILTGWSNQKLCGFRPKSYFFENVTEDITFKFHSDNTVNKNGFNASYVIEPLLPSPDPSPVVLANNGTIPGGNNTNNTDASSTAFASWNSTSGNSTNGNSTNGNTTAPNFNSTVPGWNTTSGNSTSGNSTNGNSTTPNWNSTVSFFNSTGGNSTNGNSTNGNSTTSSWNANTSFYNSTGGNSTNGNTTAPSWNSTIPSWNSTQAPSWNSTQNLTDFGSRFNATTSWPNWNATTPNPYATELPWITEEWNNTIAAFPLKDNSSFSSSFFRKMLQEVNGTSIGVFVINYQGYNNMAM